MSQRLPFSCIWFHLLINKTCCFPPGFTRSSPWGNNSLRPDCLWVELWQWLNPGIQNPQKISYQPMTTNTIWQTEVKLVANNSVGCRTLVPLILNTSSVPRPSLSWLYFSLRVRKLTRQNPQIQWNSCSKSHVPQVWNKAYSMQDFTLETPPSNSWR